MFVDQDFLNSCQHANTDKVYIKGYTFSPTGAAAKIQFSTEREGRMIRWHQSKRLQQGTIVALNPHDDNFRTTCKVAVVDARSLKDVQRDPPQIEIFWSDAEEAEFDPTERHVMIESKSEYFEASRHMLLAFQKNMFERYTSLTVCSRTSLILYRTPLSDYLIKAEGKVDTTDFIEAQPREPGRASESQR